MIAERVPPIVRATTGVKAARAVSLPCRAIPGGRVDRLNEPQELTTGAIGMAMLAVASPQAIRRLEARCVALMWLA